MGLIEIFFPLFVKIILRNYIGTFWNDEELKISKLIFVPSLSNSETSCNYCYSKWQNIICFEYSALHQKYLLYFYRLEISLGLFFICRMKTHTKSWFLNY